MSRINILDKKTSNAIKAGEVIDRPVSVVKELFDNAVDAGADKITVEFESGGIALIRVSDNGVGMDSTDAENAFLIHATSKIKSIDDLSTLTTMGFRGEALPSVAACSKVTLVTKQNDSKTGTKIEYEDGVMVSKTECASDVGTVVTVRDLFYNMPARYKFLKKDSTESSYICTLVEKLAIVNPHISVRLIKDGQVILNTQGNGEMYDAIYSIFGKALATNLIAVDNSYEGLRVKGFVSKPDYVRGNRGLQYFFVNERPVKSVSVSSAVDEAYRNYCMKGKFPICFLCIYVDPSEVDCNVHPQKIEVKFSDDSNVFRLIYHGIRNAITDLSSSAISLATDTKELSASDKFLFENLKEAGSGVSSDSLAVSTSSSVSYEPISRPAGSNSGIKGNDKPTQVEVRAANNLLNILSGVEIFDSENTSEEETKSDVALQIVSNETSESVLPKNDIEELQNSKLIGFVFATYIILQSDRNVFVVDQHAAHERILYEKFLKEKSESKGMISVTQLLIPQIIKLSASDYSFVSDSVEDFRSKGFDIELLDDCEIALRSLPDGVSEKKIADSFSELISSLRKELPKEENAWYAAIATMACRAAIKGHDLINAQEVKALLDGLSGLNDPYHCPHGRPTYMKYSQTDIEKMFKRIV